MTSTIQAALREQERQVGEAMKEALRVLFRGLSVDDPYAMHKAVESLPYEVLKEITDGKAPVGG